MSLRLVAAMVAVVLLALLVQDVPLAGYLRDVERERIVTALERDAFVLAGRSEEALHDALPDADGRVSALAQLYRTSSGARVVIVDRAGVAIVTSDEDGSGVGDSFLSRPEISESLAGGVTTGTRFSVTLGLELLYVAVPVLSGDKILGAVRLTYPNRVVDDAVNAKLSTLGLVGLTTVLLAVLIGLVFSRSVTRPLRLLRGATDRFSEGDRAVRADERVGPPELRSLSRSFNGMAGRIDALLEQQRGFAADASHQLRTPLTALRLRLERARELAPIDSAGAVRRLEAADAELDRLETLIQGLLVLSRAEGSGVAVEVVDLGEAAAARVEQWSALAAESGKRVSYDGPASVGVLAVPTAVDQIVDNLVDNALGISPDGSEVTVRVVLTGGRVALHVLDRGPGLTADERAHAFERFWRGRGEQERRGSGLGLAIVEQLARASGATAELAAREGGGLDARVSFVPGRVAPGAVGSPT
ncbi:HAMP domain-containing sensor histidine kinase [soil metagenome]